MAAYKSTPEPSLDLIEGAPLAPAAQQPTAASATAAANGATGVNGSTSGNWTGWASTATNNTWQTAESTFATPNVRPTCGGGSSMAIWAGLGGYTSPDLLQAGIAFNEGIPGQVSIWTPFFEYLNGSFSNPPNELFGAGNTALSIQPGDQIFTSTYYVGGPNQETSFYVEDETTGKVAGILLLGLGAYYSGTSAEAIVEFPNFNGGQYGAGFQSFATGDVNNQTVGGAWYNPSQTAKQSWQVYNNGRYDILTSGLSGGGSEFSNSFANCVPTSLP
jgi:hypothetical protein